MKNRLIAIAMAFALVFAFNVFAQKPAPAQALGWNTLFNYSSTNHNILVSTTDPYVYSITLYPNGRTDRASCFRLLEDMHSFYGGKYYAFTTRCFAGSGSTLALYSGLS